ncbi:prolipoprotein diacylglyceryl transferase family protein [Gordoniibacillus kamchatkensis]|uniref:prolipoprotein diacylglyceryl transferase family protein n=1 Tax=Gordoniibacillus kamchatkensis TaxID=1590651 RepID=UPI001E2C5F9E|nr:prolipoprotein diacylglyceryl transferase family protein [Paenibacillus sp. VKM B-2647]
MKVILFMIGDYPVRAYGTIIAIAILLSLGVALYLARGSEYRKHLWDVVFYVILGAIVGARCFSRERTIRGIFSNRLPFGRVDYRSKEGS